MTTLDAIIVGAVQGFTEFLPVSSSGHLVVTRYFYGVPDLTLQFDVLLHGGTLAAVVAALWKDILAIGRDVLAWNERGKRLLTALVIATVPGALFGYLFGGRIDELFCEKGIMRGGLMISPYQLVGAAFICTAYFILRPANDIIRKRLAAGEAGTAMGAITYQNALVIGLAQALAVVPGISRSGATLSAGIWSGMSQRDAARFSFLMAIPIILGAVAHQVRAAWVPLQYDANMRPMLVGVACAAVTGFIAVKWMLRLLESKDLHKFIVYLWIIGLLCVAS